MSGQTEGVQTLLGDPKRAIVRLAVPMIVAMSAHTIYSLADAIWVAGVSRRALAAVGLYFPYFILNLAIAVGLGVGAGSAIARRIGARDKPGADRVASHGVVLLAVLAVAFVTPMILFTRPLMAAVGAGAALDASVSYGRLMFAGAPLFMFNSFGGAILRNEGDAKRSMIAMLSGAGLNIVLDPIFIYVFDLGLVGAAWASMVAGACVAGGLAGWLFRRADTYVTFRFRGFRFRREILQDIARVGAPAAMSHASMFVMAAAITRIVATVGGQDGVAVYTTGWRIVMLAVLPLLGIAGAVTAVTGAAYGAGDPAKLRTAYLYALKIGVLVESALAVVTFAAAPLIVLLFTWSKDASRLVDDLVTFLRIFWLIYPAMAVGMVTASLFQGVGRGTVSLTLTILRTVVFSVPLAWLFGIALDGGLAGVWWGMVVANVVFVVVPLAWARSFLRGQGTESPTVEVS